MSAALNEVHVLYAFCAGVAAQSVFFLRTKRQLAWAALIAALGAGFGVWVGWPDARPLTVAAGGVLFYALVFSIAFRARMILAISPAVVLHFVILAYYVVFLSSCASQVVMPRSVIVGGAVPGAFIALGILLGWNRVRAFRVLCYVSYIVCFCVIVLGQVSLLDAGSLRGAGASVELFAYVFMAGAVFFLFVGNLAQLLLIIPFPERASTRIIHEKIMGPINYHREQAALMAQRVGQSRPDATGLLLVLAQLAFVVANVRVGLVSHGLAVIGSVAFVYLAVIPWEKARKRAASATMDFRGPG